MDAEGDIYGPCPGSVLKFTHTCRGERKKEGKKERKKERKKENSVRVAGNLTKSLTESLSIHQRLHLLCSAEIKISIYNNNRETSPHQCESST
jgi:hypothetical protein